MLFNRENEFLKRFIGLITTIYKKNIHCSSFVKIDSASILLMYYEKRFVYKVIKVKQICFYTKNGKRAFIGVIETTIIDFVFTKQCI